MKKYFFALCCLLVSYFSFSQWDKKKYQDFWNKGDSLYGTKEYKNAALAYSAALVVSAGDVSSWENWITANSWCRANYPDSSFFYLNSIANSKNVTFSNLDDIITDKDLNPLHNDKRWQRFKDEMFLKAYKTFQLAQKEAGGEFITHSQNDIAFALSLGNNDDSAFHHLNDAAYLFLKKKMFEKAYKLFNLSINNFPPNFTLFQNMADYYIATGDKGRAYIYFSRAEVVKYKQDAFISNTSLNFDSSIKTEYRNFSKITGIEYLPPEYLIKLVADSIFEKGMIEKAYTLLKTNIENNPGSFRALKNMGTFYAKQGDNDKANEYNTKSLIRQYELPENFFMPSFNIEEYIISRHDSLTKRRGGKVRAPELIINTLANHFLNIKMFDKAESLFEMNIENYPQSFNAYKGISTFYEKTGDKIKEDEYNKQAQRVKTIYGIEGLFPRGAIVDTSYDTNITNPSCNINCPTILFDYVHTKGMSSLYFKPFFNLMVNDGYKTIKCETSFTKQSLVQANVVVIANPGQIPPTAGKILIDWIRQGGSLLITIKHDNSEVDEFLKSLGVETKEIIFTADSIHALLRGEFYKAPNYIVFSESENLLGNHPILNGRNNSEKIRQVQTFAARTIIGPPNSSTLLKLSESAIDYMVIDSKELDSRVAVKTKGLRTFGVAFNFGKGKVVVISSTVSFTAQLAGTGELWKIGMNTPGNDNRQFALNIMRWLTGYLK